MGIKLLANKAGALQGVDVSGVIRQAYGKGYSYDDKYQGSDHVGAIIKVETGEVVDHVVEIHEV